jgi:hypothetical protein
MRERRIHGGDVFCRRLLLQPGLRPVERFLGFRLIAAIGLIGEVRQYR